MSKTGYAGGKAIVLGEHAVVYGGPAIAVGIDRGVRARATPLAEGPSRLFVRAWGIDVQESDEDHDLAKAFRALLAVARSETPSLGAHAIEVEANLPPGSGLGCSAAMGVAVARALEPAAGEKALLERAMAWERVFHGNPSGVDAALAVRSGCFLFRKGVGLEPVRLRGSLDLCIGNTGRISSTKSMVEAVARLRERRRDVVDKAFDAIRVLVQNARLAIEAGDFHALGSLMDLNQMLLAGIFVSSPEIEHMCAVARSAGALGAKLTGAGGGGSVVALAPSQAVGEAVLAAWREAGFEGFAAVVARGDRHRSLESESAP
jgi:mevalonate kinase